MSAVRARSLGTVLLITGALSSFGVASGAEAVRTSTALGGFTVVADSAPFKVQLDDPANPLPRPTDAPIVEANPCYTEAHVDVGPTGLGIASTLWPGQLLGQGLAQVAPGAPAYPIAVNARYPDTPFEAQDQAGGSFMKASAKGLDTEAVASAGPMGVPGTIDLGAITSRSLATVDKTDVAVGRAVSRVSDIDLLGVIHIGSVSTVVEAKSNGKVSSTTGSTVVSGMTVAGVGYVVDEQGARPVGGPGAPGTGPLGTGALDPARQAGITIEGVTQSSAKDVESASRDAKGLRITVDTVLLRKTLTTYTPGEVTAQLYTLFAQAPKEIKSYLFYSLATTPKITFIIGAARTSTAATQPISFDFPPLPPPDLGGGGLPPIGPVDTGGLPPVSVGGPAVPDSGSPELPRVDTPLPVGEQPTFSEAATSAPDGSYSGISFALLLGVGVLGGLGGWGLLRLQGQALVGGLIGSGCALGAPSDVPNLRGA